MKKSQRKKVATERKLATILLVVGILLMLISLSLNFIFIDDDFKNEYREYQYNECIDRKTDVEKCESEFGY